MRKLLNNKIIFAILMIIIFFIVVEVIIWGFASDILLEGILNFPQRLVVISEAVLLFWVIILLVITKKTYVFTEKKDKFYKGVVYGLFYVIMASYIGLFALIDGAYTASYAIVNVALGCFLIGLCEELLCRGWLLNTFLERFGKDKKGVWYSIIVSGVLFGLMHLGNIFTGAGVASTIAQVIMTSATGIVYGVIYYKTKNIWTVIFLHAFWNFGVFLADLVPVYDNVAILDSFSIMDLMFSFLLALTELILIIPFIKDINSEVTPKSTIKYSFIAFFAYIFVSVLSSVTATEVGDVYEYDNISMDHYQITTDNFDVYNINYNNISIELSKDENNLILTNKNTNYEKVIEGNSIHDYIISEFNDYYILAYIDGADLYNTYLYYIYLDKNAINNDNSYIDNITNNINRYLLKSYSSLVVISDNTNSYIAAYNEDYGYYVLVGDRIAILNRD